MLGRVKVLEVAMMGEEQQGVTEARLVELEKLPFGQEESGDMVERLESPQVYAGQAE